VALRVSRTAVGGAPPLSELTFKKSPELRQDVYIEGMPFGTRGGLVVDYIVPVDGEYELSSTSPARDAVRSSWRLTASAPSCSSSCRGRGPRRTIPMRRRPPMPPT